MVTIGYLAVLLIVCSEFRLKTNGQEYEDSTSSPLPQTIDVSDDFDKYEIHEFEDPVTKNYHCMVKNSKQEPNETVVPDPEKVKYLDDTGILAIRLKKNRYQVRKVRQQLCQYGFNPFDPDHKTGSIHKRFKNTLRLMIYNTPGIFPRLKVIRNDLDRRRKREPQIWYKYEPIDGPLAAEFDYDNYFVTITGNLTRIQAYSKLLVALKMHKRLNNFGDSISYKVNLDLGVMEMILASFGIWMMKDKSMTPLAIEALNGIRSETREKNEVQLEFDESLKTAADQVDPLLYSHIWLLSMAEKYEVIKLRDKGRHGQDHSRNSTFQNNQTDRDE